MELSNAARRLAERQRGDLLLVGHGHSVVGASWGLLGERPDIHAELCGLIEIVRRNGAWELGLNGDTSHLSNRGQCSPSKAAAKSIDKRKLSP